MRPCHCLSTVSFKCTSQDSAFYFRMKKTQFDATAMSCSSIAFGLTWFCMHDPWPCLSSVWCQQKVRSMSHHHSRAWNDYVGDKNHTVSVVPPSKALAFVAKTKQKHKSRSPSALQVKNWWNTIITEEKLCKISWFEKDEQIADLCHNPRIAHSGIRTLRDNKGKVIQLQARCGPEGG